MTNDNKHKTKAEEACSVVVDGSLESLYADIRARLLESRLKVYRTANTVMVQTYWEIGRIIVEYEQSGSNRAIYGSAMISKLSARLRDEFGAGFTETNLKYMRKFYIAFRNRHSLRDELNWTHYRLLLKVSNEKTREWYAKECVKSGWSTRQLERQINSFYYERTLASRDKEAIVGGVFEKEPATQPQDFIRDPYVLDFIGVKQDAKMYESDMESALINNLEKFLLELGRGFSFVARQKHLDYDGEHFYIDLVFYNYILKCFVLIDLKTDKLTHQDIGQMDSYVRMYDDLQRGADDNPTIGIILCSEKNEAIAKYSILNDSGQIFASKYQMTLPSEMELEEYIKKERLLIEERLTAETKQD